MRIHMRSGIIEKVKDCIVDGCLLYDGTLGLLALGIALSIVLSYGALALT